MEIKSHTLSLDGAATHYLEAGNASAPPFVLIHDGGFGADGWMTWSPVMERLAARYHVFAPDLLGFGKTDKIYDFGRGARSQKIEHIARWMKALVIRDAYVMGNSAGGSLIVFAAMRGDWPIQKGISIGGTGGPYMRPDTYGPLRDYVPDKEGMRRIVELMMSRRDALMEEVVEQRYRRSLIRGHWENLSAPRLRPPGPKPREDGEGKSFLDELGRIKAPMLLIAGGDDPLLERGWEARLAARIPNAKTFVVEGARHQPHFDAPDAVCDAVESFLDA